MFCVNIFIRHLNQCHTCNAPDKMNFIMYFFLHREHTMFCLSFTNHLILQSVTVYNIGWGMLNLIKGSVVYKHYVKCLATIRSYRAFNLCISFSCQCFENDRFLLLNPLDFTITNYICKYKAEQKSLI